MRPLPVLLLIALLLACWPLSPHITQAQTVTQSCPALVQTALAQVGNDCANLEPNNACYGFDDVGANFSEPVADDFFSQPADQTGLTTLEMIETLPMDVFAGKWGIATMHVQANLPNMLPGQGVVFVLVGGVEVENGVAPEEALILPEQPLVVTTLREAVLFRAPDGEAVGTVSANTALQADGISPDGQWLRVFFESENRATAWVSFSPLQINTDVINLPVIDELSRTPMQAFYFRNGVGRPDCLEAPPSLLFVQGPNEIEVDITANGADIRVHSAIILRVLLTNNGDYVMQLITLSGLATLYPDTPDELLVPAGFTTTICLSDEQDLGINHNEDDREVGEDCTWSEPRPLTQNELEVLAGLEGIPENLLNYPAFVPIRVCASGVGNPVCEFVFDDPQIALPPVIEKCDDGSLPALMCDLYPIG